MSEEGTGGRWRQRIPGMATGVRGQRCGERDVGWIATLHELIPLIAQPPRQPRCSNCTRGLGVSSRQRPRHGSRTVATRPRHGRTPGFEKSYLSTSEYLSAYVGVWVCERVAGEKSNPKLSDAARCQRQTDSGPTLCMQASKQCAAAAPLTSRQWLPQWRDVPAPGSRRRTSASARTCMGSRETAGRQKICVSMEALARHAWVSTLYKASP